MAEASDFESGGSWFLGASYRGAAVAGGLAQTRLVTARIIREVDDWDPLTNMIQPLWALPALALAGLQARQVMGYTAVVMFFAFFIMAAGLTLLPA